MFQRSSTDEATAVESWLPVQRDLLDRRFHQTRPYRWRTAYRRTRTVVAVREMRPGDVPGRLYTAHSGSSEQAVEWLAEYCRKPLAANELALAFTSGEAVING